MPQHDVQPDMIHEWLREFFRPKVAGVDPQVHLTLCNASLGDEGWDELRPLGRGIFTAADAASSDDDWLRSLAASVAAASEALDVYCCPYPFPPGARRTKGSSASRRHIHADIDDAVPLARVQALGGFAVASGSRTADGSPRGHVYVRLTESVPLELHHALCVALGEWLGGEVAGWDASKVRDNDVLRPCGTVNHKPGAGSTSWLIHPDDGATWEPAVLMAQLGGTMPPAAGPLDAYQTSYVPKPPTSNGNGHRSRGRDRTFTRDQAEEFVEPKLQALTDAGPGKRHPALNAASVILGHFVPEFWSWDEALTLLRERTDLPEHEFARTASSGLGVGQADWQATRVEVPDLAPGAVSIEVDLDLKPSTAAAPSSPEPEPAIWVSTPPPPPPNLNLPVEFWESRPSLGWIRRAADARMCSPDAVLGAVLARISSFVNPLVRVDTGQGLASLNTFVALIGTSSAGKSVAARSARDLLLVPQSIADEYKDSLSAGTGEGFAESFYGMQTVQIPNASGTGFKNVQQRAVVRANVSFYVDEGEGLTRLMERSGSTIGTVLRTAWIGDTLGQTNASADRQREVPGGTYSLGLVIGYQRATIQPLLAEAGGGSPQRFLFLSAHSEPPEKLAEWPGDMPLRLPRYPMRLPKEACQELFEARREAMRPGANETGLNGHRPLHLAKAAALLCILDGRTDMTMVDWELAHLLWDTSCAVRDDLVEQVKVESQQKVQQEERRTIRVTSLSAVASHRALRQVVDEEIMRMASWVGNKVHDRKADEPWKEVGKGSLTQAQRSTRRARMPDAIDEAEARGWVERVEIDGACYVVAGPSRP